ncbi:hypothetical protein AVEN_218172-1 [Araneus ventricosus]|uniref:Uncharacterized protein n=1 Tax=Araneus ventricosus TaxID=182803 RepID=A0A4Y2FUG4_ARAVE|nr:hypothetical protein AVEN_218172-1 [Araneus ventricosus]
MEGGGLPPGGYPSWRLSTPETLTAACENNQVVWGAAMGCGGAYTACMENRATGGGFVEGLLLVAKTTLSY